MSAERDLQYLRAITREEFTDWTNDHLARPACERLAANDLCRVVQQDERSWRVYQSPQQRMKAVAILKEPSK